MKASHALAAAALFTLAACETPAPSPPAGNVLPIKTVLAETKGRPYECSEYDPASDSCEALSRWRIIGNTVEAQTVFALNEGLPARITVVSRHTLSADGRICGLKGQPRIRVESDGSPEAERAIEELFTVLIAGALTEACGSYFRAQQGYITEATDRAGQLLPDGRGTSRFFATPKKLRALKP